MAPGSESIENAKNSLSVFAKIDHLGPSQEYVSDHLESIGGVEKLHIFGSLSFFFLGGGGSDCL